MTALAAVRQRQENVANGAREGLRYGVKESIAAKNSIVIKNPPAEPVDFLMRL